MSRAPVEAPVSWLAGVLVREKDLERMSSRREDIDSLQVFSAVPQCLLLQSSYSIEHPLLPVYPASVISVPRYLPHPKDQVRLSVLDSLGHVEASRSLGQGSCGHERFAPKLNISILSGAHSVSISLAVFHYQMHRYHPFLQASLLGRDSTGYSDSELFVHRSWLSCTHKTKRVSTVPLNNTRTDGFHEQTANLSRFYRVPAAFPRGEDSAARTGRPAVPAI